jgi:hypothetical protein
MCTAHELTEIKKGYKNYALKIWEFRLDAFSTKQNIKTKDKFESSFLVRRYDFFQK